VLYATCRSVLISVTLKADYISSNNEVFNTSLQKGCSINFLISNDWPLWVFQCPLVDVEYFSMLYYPLCIECCHLLNVKTVKSILK